MNKNERVTKFFDIVSREDLYSSANNLKYYLNYLFKNIEFANKRMLEIGGGIGLFSYYAFSMGAIKVIRLEPESQGATKGISEKSERLRSYFGEQVPVFIKKVTLQNFNYEKKFDIILLHNSINHLDEEACINLKHNKQAVEAYKGIFKKIYDLANNNAKIIIHDCSRYNFFSLLNLKNPFAPSIEWYKHQSPKFWAKLLMNTGFTNPNIRWTSYNPLRLFGRLILGNQIATYFLHSLFCLTMKKE